MAEGSKASFAQAFGQIYESMFAGAISPPLKQTSGPSLTRSEAPQVGEIVDRPWFRHATDGPGIVAGVRDVLSRDSGTHYARGTMFRDSSGVRVDYIDSVVPGPGIASACAMGAVYMVSRTALGGLVKAPGYVHQAVNMIARELVRLGYQRHGRSTASLVALVNDYVGREKVVEACDAALASYEAGDLAESDNCTKRQHLAYAPEGSVTFSVWASQYEVIWIEYDASKIKAEKPVAPAKRFAAAVGYGEAVEFKTKALTVAPAPCKAWWLDAPQLKEAA